MYVLLQIDTDWAKYIGYFKLVHTDGRSLDM